MEAGEFRKYNVSQHCRDPGGLMGQLQCEGELQESTRGFRETRQPVLSGLPVVR